MTTPVSAPRDNAIAHFLAGETPPFGIDDYTVERPVLAGENGVPLIAGRDGVWLARWQWFVCGKMFVSTFAFEPHWDAERVRAASFKAHADVVAKVKQVMEAGIAATGGESDPG